MITFFEDVYRIYKAKRAAAIVPNDEMGKADFELLLRLHKERKPEAVVVAEEFFERGTTLVPDVGGTFYEKLHADLERRYVEKCKEPMLALVP